MTPDPVIDSEPPTFNRSSESINKSIATWATLFFSNASRVAALLWFAGAVAVAILLPLHNWAPIAFIYLVVSVSCAIGFVLIRVTIGERLPSWSLQVDVATANLLICSVTWAAGGQHINVSNLFMLSEIFALLYLPIRSAASHLVSAGVGYAVVLTLSVPLAEPKIIAWLSTFGTSTVLAIVIAELMSVLRSAARNDPLTGLSNRRSWEEHLLGELERAIRSGEVFSVIIIDLDGFKAVNDAHGHSAGDMVLVASARAFESATRSGVDFLARLGGDEFGLIAPNTDEVTARGLARRLKKALPKGVTASAGVATWDRNESASELVRRADIAMYQSKRNNRLGGNPSSA